MENIRVMVVQEINGVANIYAAGGKNIDDYVTGMEHLISLNKNGSYYHFKDVSNLLNLLKITFQDRR